MSRPKLVHSRNAKVSAWRRRGRAAWSMAGVPILGLAVAFALGWTALIPVSHVADGAALAPVAHGTGVAISVIDGDTIRVNGRTTRLIGFNAPETFEPRCREERVLGNRATARMRTLVAANSVSFADAVCACPPGTEGTGACNYGRACGVLAIDGRDVADILVSEGVAVPFICSGTRCPPTPRPWCAT